jgi:hypothetical protein
MISAVRRLPLSALLAVLALCAAPALAAGGANRVVGNCTRSQVRPRSIILACADDNAYLAKIQWTSFGGQTAAGSGVYAANTCTPSCVAGKLKSYPITFTATDAKPCPGGVDDYRRLSITFTAAPPKSLGARYYPKLFCPIP